MSCLVMLRDSPNAPRTNRAPPVRPSQLRHLPPRSFFDMLNEQSERLRVTLSPEQIEDIEVKFLRFRKDPFVQAAREGSRYDYLEKSRGPFAHRNKHFRNFVGVLSTVFTGTASVESCFSLVNYEVNRQRRRLSNVSLAGILHSKQWHQVGHVAHHDYGLIGWLVFSSEQIRLLITHHYRPKRTRRIVTCHLLSSSRGVFVLGFNHGPNRRQWKRCPNMSESGFRFCPILDTFGHLANVRMWRSLLAYTCLMLESKACEYEIARKPFVHWLTNKSDENVNITLYSGNQFWCSCAVFNSMQRPFGR